MIISLPDTVKKILTFFNQSNTPAYLVGGAVRDIILNKIPTDFDICTPASVDEIKSIFHSCKIIDTGIDFGTLTVIFENTPFEITTFRSDNSYNDGRHPDNVVFTDDIYTDLSRRDFTINALAADIDGNICDYFGGINDIIGKIVKAVGDPEKRFEEDALRILRCLRFASQLDFKIEAKTSDAIFSKSYMLDKISGERILPELIKILSYSDESFLLSYSPVLEGFCGYRPSKRNISAVTVSEKEPSLLLASYFYGSKNIDKIISRLKLSRIASKEIKMLNFSAGSLINDDSRADFIIKYGFDKYIMATSFRQSLGFDVSKDTKLIEDIVRENRCHDMKSLNINGNILMNEGLQGQAVGEILNKLLKMTILGKMENEQNALILETKK